MYFVVKEDVYDQGVFFIGNEEDAKAAAVKFAKADHDDHHEWCVREFIQSTLSDDPDWWRGYADNSEEVFSIRRSKALEEE